MDDSATESETESDREYLGLPPLKQKAPKQCVIKLNNIVLALTGKNRAVDKELAPDSDPEGTKYVSVKVRSEVPTLTALFTRAPTTRRLLGVNTHLRRKHYSCRQNGGTYRVSSRLLCEHYRHTHPYMIPAYSFYDADVYLPIDLCLRLPNQSSLNIFHPNQAPTAVCILRLKSSQCPCRCRFFVPRCTSSTGPGSGSNSSTTVASRFCFLALFASLVAFDFAAVRLRFAA